ncbi:efflux RND transporter periplasmic adaptor subunit [Methylopila musalis]|uniref:Efflux RND transporter periplasmic adaptor subunit n=1 Tax=Methylopila musalis TaxID=1134781 RepID=A0ABW3Z3Z3_9HYPH
MAMWGQRGARGGRRIGPLAAVAALAVALLGCDEKKPDAAPETPPVSVGVVTVAPETLPIANDLPGRIAPTRLAEVRPRVSGIVVARVFEQGGHVREGDVLYRIDPAPFQVRVDGARAALARAEAARALAREQADRQTQLRERRITSDQLYDSAVAELAQTDADVAAARAGLAAAELDLQYAEVRAPIGGRIGRALITEGALVSAADSLATIQQLDPIYADFTQSANQLLALRRAAQAGARAEGRSADRALVRLLFDDGSAYAHEGRFLFSEAAVDATTGQITLRGEFPNPDGDLLPGLYVRVEIVQGEQANALAVPERAIQRDPGGASQLYVVGPDNKAELRTVRAGRLVRGRWVIDQGLKPGDRVVVEGFQALAPGAAVDPQPFRPDAPAAAAAR